VNDLQAIRVRRSVRSYLSQPLEPGRLEALEQFIAANQVGPLGTTVRIALVDLPDGGAAPMRWTYGVIRGATRFLVGAVTPSPRTSGPVPIAGVDFGHCFERVVLEATRQGLGTCWLGGTFSGSVFSERIGLRPGEVLPIVSPVGIGIAERSLIDRTFRLFAGSDHRKPWSELFFSDARGTVLTPAAAGRFAEPLECVRLAPSASNKQPWRVVADVAGGKLHFGLARNRITDKAVSPVSLQEIDLGIALCHLELACRAEGLKGTWSQLAQAPELPSGVEYVATWTE